jgi:hypothetical protein
MWMLERMWERASVLYCICVGELKRWEVLAGNRLNLCNKRKVFQVLQFVGVLFPFVWEPLWRRTFHLKDGNRRKNGWRRRSSVYIFGETTWEFIFLVDFLRKELCFFVGLFDSSLAFECVVGFHIQIENFVFGMKVLRWSDDG